MGPGEPRQPDDEGARRPQDDDENFGYDDPAFRADGPEYVQGTATPGPGYSPDAGYFLAEHVVLHDLSDGIPPELVYGAPSPYLHGRP